VGKGRRGERLHAHTREIGVPSTPNRAPCRSRPFEAFRGHQRRSKAIRGDQRRMEGESRAYQIETDDVIRGPSEAISGRYLRQCEVLEEPFE